MMQAEQSGQSAKEEYLAARLAALRNDPALADAVPSDALHLPSGDHRAQSAKRDVSDPSAQGQAPHHAAASERSSSAHQQEHKREEAQGMAQRLAALRDSARLPRRHRSHLDAVPGAHQSADADAYEQGHSRGASRDGAGSRPGSAEKRGVVRRAWNALSHSGGETARGPKSVEEQPAKAVGDNLAAQRLAIKGVFAQTSIAAWSAAWPVWQQRAPSLFK